ncbi:T-cell immunomodulatory protein, partial [Desmophyllum pertusum]
MVLIKLDLTLSTRPQAQMGKSNMEVLRSCPSQLTLLVQCPYTVFGLGRTPNFVDELAVGIPRSINS